MDRRRVIGAAAGVVDLALAPFVLPASILLKIIRRTGLQHFPISRAILQRVGLIPVTDHYYEPYIDARALNARSTIQQRTLPGIDWNISEQLRLLQSFTHTAELSYFGNFRTEDRQFQLGNGSFESGDAEYLYQFIRTKKPRRVIEVGSGHSTLLARDAISMNAREDSTYACDHLCIEPFEAPWLEGLGIKVLRKKVEDVEPSTFQSLQSGDLLFIDSSHVIRPQGDVLVEYLQIMPSLRPGVFVHIHDIFSPRDYLPDWQTKNIWLWNEQYLLEAFLTNNRDWKVIGALNFLKHQHFSALKMACPFLTEEREPGSIYLQKIA